jgi:hypothetical protein
MQPGGFAIEPTFVMMYAPVPVGNTGCFAEN